MFFELPKKVLGQVSYLLMNRILVNTHIEKWVIIVLLHP